MFGLENVRFLRRQAGNGAADEFTLSGILSGTQSTYYEGLLRVAKTIDATPDYGGLIDPKIKPFFRRMRIRAEGEDCIRAHAKSLFFMSLRNFWPLSCPLDRYSWIAYGKTRNNLREFSFLEALLRRNNISVECDNLGLKQPVRVQGPVNADSFFISSILRDFDRYCDQRDRLSAALFYQLLQYTKSYINWKHTVSAAASRNLSLAIVANDHSPTNVAFAMRLKELGIPRLYIQHAEVSGWFPVLDFELSILRNQASLDIYSDIGPIPGKVFILPREQGRFDAVRLQKAGEVTSVLGVYLTARINFSKLTQAVELLLRNSAAERIFIKPHPSTPLEKLREVLPERVSIESEIPPYEHIAIVSNSSVVVELLHRGIPVYQTFEMDPVPDDYYGFVSNGIAFHVAFRDLSSKFWQGYGSRINEDWLKAFSRLDPTVDGTWEDTEKKFIAEIRKYLKDSPPAGSNGGTAGPLAMSRMPVAGSGKDDKAPAHDHGFLRDALQFAPYTVFKVQAAMSMLSRPPGREHRIWNRDDVLITKIESLFNERNLSVPAIFEAAWSVEPRSAPVIWARLKDIQWTRRRIPDAELGAIFDFIMNYRGPAKALSGLETIFFAYLARVGDVDRIAAFLRRSKFVRMDSLHINRRIELLRIIRANPGKIFLFEDMIDNLVAGLSDFNRLKLRVMIRDSEDDLDQFDHQEIEKRFEALSPAPLAREFRDSVRTHYEALRPRLSFMDVRFKRAERESFYSEISRALKLKTPFSLLRLSDREGYIFEGRCRFFTEEDIRNCERHWWGREIPAGLRAEFLPRILDAVSRADVVGIPCVYRFLRDHTDGSSSLAQGLQGRGLLEVINGVGGLAGPQARFSEEKCNVPLFRSPDACRRILEEAPRVVVVSSANGPEIPKVLPFVRELITISIPTHFSMRKNDKYAVVDQPLPYTYRSVISQIRDTVKPGDLVMVAGGVIGKIFVDEARNCGAVSLDLGGALDIWIGAEAGGI